MHNTCFRCSAPPSIEVNSKHHCVNGCRCFPTVSTCSFTLELYSAHIQNEKEMLSVFSAALVADVGFGRCYLFCQIKFMLINCIYKYCIFYINVLGCFLKLFMVLRFQTGQHEKLFASLSFVIVSERSSHWRCSSKTLSHKLSSWTFLLKIFDTYLGRSSILLKLHVCNLDFY